MCKYSIGCVYQKNRSFIFNSYTEDKNDHKTIPKNIENTKNNFTLQYFPCHSHDLSLFFSFNADTFPNLVCYY